MSDNPLKKSVQEAMKSAMKAGEKSRLGVIRLILAAIKQREVDERIELDDAQCIEVMSRMLKQRRESISQYTQAGRTDLADQEEYEIGVIQNFLPSQLSSEEIAELISAAMAESGASSMKDMGKVMGLLKPKLQGRADMSAVSAQIKAALST
jgi:uncharacterized protein YqeY